MISAAMAWFDALPPIDAALLTLAVLGGATWLFSLYVLAVDRRRTR